MTKHIHASDCAVHNEPAYPVGSCDCGADPGPSLVEQMAMVYCKDDYSGDPRDFIPDVVKMLEVLLGELPLPIWKAGEDHLCDTFNCDCDETVIFHAMIQAILNEGEGR